MSTPDRTGPPRMLSNAPIKFKILSLVMIAFLLPFALCVSLIRANFRAVESFAEDVDTYAAMNRLKDTNDSLSRSLPLYLQTGVLEDLYEYNLEVDCFVAALAFVEASVTDLEARFLLHAIRNSFLSMYDEAHLAIRARITGLSDPYAPLYRAARIERYLDDYISSLLDKALMLGTESNRLRLERAVLARTFAAVALACVGVFCVALGIVFSNYVTGPLRALAAAAAHMTAGELSIEPVPIVSSDEVGALTGSFNAMSAHIAALIGDLREKAAVEKRLHLEELRNERNKKLIRESEFLALQARINPHFLFNTLNSISRDVILHGGRDAIALVEALSSLLRYGLDQGGGVTTLEAELEIVKKYVYIQRYRFRDRIAVEIECRVDNAGSIRLPAFSIQPLVENAFIHGLEPKVGGGSIRVTAERRKSAVAVTVADDGIGVGAERIRAVTHGKELSRDGHLSSIGLSNVRDRLRLFTGDPHCFTLRAREGAGTVAEILLRKPSS